MVLTRPTRAGPGPPPAPDPPQLARVRAARLPRSLAVPRAGRGRGGRCGWRRRRDLAARSQGRLPSLPCPAHRPARRHPVDARCTAGPGPGPGGQSESRAVSEPACCRSRPIAAGRTRESIAAACGDYGSGCGRQPRGQVPAADRGPVPSPHPTASAPCECARFRLHQSAMQQERVRALPRAWLAWANRRSRARRPAGIRGRFMAKRVWKGERLRQANLKGGEGDPGRMDARECAGLRLGRSASLRNRARASGGLQGHGVDAPRNTGKGSVPWSRRGFSACWL